MDYESPNQLVNIENDNINASGEQTSAPVNSALFNNLQKKSLDQEPIIIKEHKRYSGHQKLINILKIVTCAFVTSAVVSVSAHSVVSVINTIKKEQELHELYHDASSIVYQNSHRTEDLEHYWIDYYKVAEGLATLDGDFNINLYGVYQSVGWNDESKIDQMNTIMGYCNQLNLTNYKDFVDLCHQNGYCNEQGEVDLKKYQKSMYEYLENVNTIENNQDNSTMKR